ncbi:hypothetical protein E4198_14160 [Streptomyces sp. RKND-216]|uniref:hypothetical protein n=1 Tax=Streptomyces sp. RKND-216 TaxID=2562581 RepID=UPI00109DEF54|nr:hypothetical protein [Streptomyces sp. RKND-216]THA25687.1 hypothetical protein E4198_14160 [Streptomyces sp. RKND-216]
MSIGGDEYDEQGRTSGAGTSTRRAPARGTRTRLPGEDGDVYGVGRRPAGRPGRSLLMVVSVVVLLIAAIAFANRSGSSGSEGEENDPGGGPAAQPTAPSGQMPVQTEDGTTGIPSGFPQTEQGAQSAAANYAVALGGDRMFNRDSRHQIVSAISAPSAVEEIQSGFDADYNQALNDRIGLDTAGRAPEGSTFVNRTTPVGAKVTSYNGNDATVEVWCSGLFGLAGEDSTKPVTANWFTVTFKLSWAGSDWKVAASSQESGPTPVSGDNPISTADEIGSAAEQYGGFTYAR